MSAAQFDLGNSLTKAFLSDESGMCQVDRTVRTVTVLLRYAEPNTL